MKKVKNKQAKGSSAAAKAENLKHSRILVKNADGEPDTTADIVVQNHIEYTPKVSVIIPVYNVDAYLRECLDSVINQTLKDIEIICVDDGSTDKSLDILKEYAAKDNRITVLKQQNLHAGVARNAGLAVAKGKYLSFLDSDDFFELNMLEEMYQVVEQEKSEIIYYQYMNFDDITHEFGESRGINKKYIKAHITTYDTASIKEDLFTICNPMPWNKLIKHDFVIREGLHFQSLAAANDVCFSLTAIACSKRISLSDKSFVYYRHNREGSLKNTRDKNPFDFYQAYTGIHKLLQKKGLYENCKKAFLQSLVSSALWTLEHTESMRGKVKEFIKSTIIPEYGLLSYNIECLNDDKINKLKRLYNHDIIVSLTSYPARIDTVNQTIETLLKQSMKADKVILWLAPEQFPNKEADLPQQLLDLREKGLTIDWYHDIKSYKKLIPTLKKYPDAIIITADDDLLYGRDWLKWLYISYEKEPQYIHCHRITRVYYANDKLKVVSRDLYTNKNGNYIAEICKPSAYNKLSGGAGTLFPPHCFTDEVLNEDKFMELAPTSDDIWFWLMGLYNGFKVKVIDNNIYKLNYVPDTQEVGLCRINDTAGYKTFYEHLNNILGAYNKNLKPVFEADYAENQKICDMLFTKNLIKNQEKLSSWYQRVTKERIDINNPRTFNEKIQWMKLYDSTPIKTKLADKYLVRDWVKDKIGEEYLIPLLGVYDKFEDIDFAKLPKQFVIKCNHGCAYNIIVKDKSQLDLADVKAKLDKWMHENFGLKAGTELHYRDIKPKIIIEKFIENKGADDLYDYKFWCFGGKLYYIQFLSERNLDGLKMAFYDRNWNKQTFVYSYPLDTKIIEKPDNLDLMIKLAEKLAAGFSHVRVDFYRLNDGKIYFGEMTFTSASGVCLWNENGINEYFGSLIKLPKMAYNIDTGKYYKSPWLKNKLHNIILYPYNKYIAAFWENKKNLRNISSEIWHKVDTFRLDIKNTGTADNATQISGNNVNIINPAWYNTASGKGQIVSGIASRQQLKIKAIKDGRLRLAFRGMDRRYNGERFPVWIDYKSIRINGKEILSAPVSAWHDAPFNYSLPVKNGEIIKLDFVQEAHKYSLAELKDLILKLGGDTEFVVKRIENLAQRVNHKIAEANQLTEKYLKSTKHTRSKLFSITHKKYQHTINILGHKFCFVNKHAQLLQQILELQKQVESDKQTILRLMENIKADNKKSYAELKKLLSK